MMPDYRAGNAYQQLLSDAVQQTAIAKIRFPIGYRRGLPLLRALNDSADCGILHLHWLAPYFGGRSAAAKATYGARLLGDLWMARRSGRKIVWTLHNRLSHDCRYPRIELTVRRQVARLASAVIVHDQQAAKWAQETLLCPADKISVIPHGNYNAAYLPAIPRRDARELLGLPQSPRVVLFFGFLRPYKGIQGLLRTWNDLAAGDSLLLIAGQCSDKVLEDEIRNLIGNSQRIIWHDRFVSDDRLHLYYSSADLAVLPFRAIQTSGSAMLALTYSKPIIAPRLGGLPEALAGADDFLYDATDPHGLRRTLDRAMSAELVDVARRAGLAAKRFDWERIGVATTEVYRKVLASIA